MPSRHALPHVLALLASLGLAPACRAQDVATTATAAAMTAAPDSLAAAPLPRRGPAPAWRSGLLRADRLQHASLSFTLASGLGLLGRPRAHALAITLAFGVAKEARDARRDRFDPLDLAADLAGGALGAFLAARR